MTRTGKSQVAPRSVKKVRSSLEEGNMNVRTYMLNTKQAQLIADALDIIQPDSTSEQKRAEALALLFRQSLDEPDGVVIKVRICRG
jgi:hypothetical protein